MSAAPIEITTAVVAVVDGLDRLASVAGLPTDAAAAAYQTVGGLRRRLDPERPLHIAIIGEKKAGKSTFLNALLGVEVLGSAAREYTAATTLIQSAPALSLAVDGEPRSVADLDGLAAAVRALADAATGGVERLDVGLPNTTLPEGLVLIDTPGLNTSLESHRRRTWATVEQEADGCWLLSDLQQAMSASTLTFAEHLVARVPHMSLLLTKVDRARENAEMVGSDPDEELREALVVARRRLAAMVQRRPKDVIVVPVSASSALANDDRVGLATGFRTACDGLIAEAWRTRPLVVAARAAVLVGPSADALLAAAADGEAAVSERLSRLEESRVPDPAAWRSEQVLALAGELRSRAAALHEQSLDDLAEALGGCRAVLSRQIGAVDSRATASRLAETLPKALEVDLHLRLEAVERQASENGRRAVLAVARNCIGALQTRYHLAELGAWGDSRRVSEVSSMARGTLEPLAGISQVGPACSTTPWESGGWLTGAEKRQQLLQMALDRRVLAVRRAAEAHLDQRRGHLYNCLLGELTAVIDAAMGGLHEDLTAAQLDWESKRGQLAAARLLLQKERAILDASVGALKEALLRYAERTPGVFLVSGGEAWTTPH